MIAGRQNNVVRVAAIGLIIAAFLLIGGGVQQALYNLLMVSGTSDAGLLRPNALNLLPYTLMIASGIGLGAFGFGHNRRRQSSLLSTWPTRQAWADICLAVYGAACFSAYLLLGLLVRVIFRENITLVIAVSTAFIVLQTIILAGWLVTQSMAMLDAFQAKTALRGLSVVIVLLILDVLVGTLADRFVAQLMIDSAPDLVFAYSFLGAWTIVSSFSLGSLMLTRACWAWAQNRQIELTVAFAFPGGVSPLHSLEQPSQPESGQSSYPRPVPAPTAAAAPPGSSRTAVVLIIVLSLGLCCICTTMTSLMLITAL